MNTSTAFSKTSGRVRYWPKTLVMMTLVAACLPLADAAAQIPNAFSGQMIPLVVDTSAQAPRVARNTAAKDVPDYAGQVMLIRNTLTAVNHGNITGNYTVLRDLSSERFRQRNKASDLATTFVNLRKQKLDLSPILVIEPQITQRPAQDQYGRMQLVGYVPTKPQAVRFGLVFQKINRAWVIDEITLGVVPIESVVRTQPSPPSPPRYQSPRTAARPHARENPPYNANRRYK